MKRFIESSWKIKRQHVTQVARNILSSFFNLLVALTHSFFLNRYVEEHIQRTGVAIETQGFSFITSGRKRESLTVSITIILS